MSKRNQVIDIINGVFEEDPASYSRFYGLVANTLRKTDESYRKEREMRIQAYTSADESLTQRVIKNEIGMGAAVYDKGWEYFLSKAIVTDRKFDMGFVDSGFTFHRMKEGEAAKIYKISGEIAYSILHRYSAALGITEEAIGLKAINTIVDAMKKVVPVYYGTQAEIAYGVIRASAQANIANAVAYDTTGSTQLDKDINTLSNAYKKLSNINEGTDIDFSVDNIAPMIFHDDMKERVLGAMSSRYQPTSTSSLRVSRPIVPIFTRMKAAFPNGDTTKAIIGFRRTGNKYGIEEMTELSKEKDALTLESIKAYHFWMNAAVADPKAFVQVSFA